MVGFNVMISSFKKVFQRTARFIGIKRHAHEEHPMTLRRLILFACVFSLMIVGTSSWLFYQDPRSKYDLVRPGRRELPEEFRADEGTLADTKDDIKLEIQRLRTQLRGLEIYGGFNDDALSDYKVLQNYLDQPVVEQ
jgi:hypothetical protein